jgi:pectate lyase
MLTTIQRVQKFLCTFAVALFGSCGTSIALAQSVPMLVQAEAMSTAGSTKPMAVGNDIGAMGGRFISAASGATTTNTPVMGASVQVNVPTGTYFLWARIAGPTPTSDALYVGIDSSFARVFPTTAPAGSYQWVKVATTDGGTTFAFSLGGTHTIQVGYGEVGAKLDAVYLTADANDVPGFAPPLKMLIEAESLNRVAPMTVGSEPAALSGQYLSPTTGADSMTPAREAWITLDAPAGTYYLWARIAGPTNTNDALYAGIDSFARIFPLTAPSGSYEWVRVATSDGGTSFGFNFNAPGIHEIKVGHGEIGARLDALYLTTDQTEVPAFAPVRRMIEAESFNLQTKPPTMSVNADPSASGGQYLTTTDAQDTMTPAREAWTTFNVPSGGGTYYLWARIMGPTINSDALYVGFDNTFVRIFPSGTGAYEWVRVEATQGSVTGFTLDAGAHAVQAAHGEVGARLDAVYLTDSATDTPPSVNPPPPPPTGDCALPTGQYQYQGFGGNTTGGLGREIYVVSDLSDDDTTAPYKPHTLRDALSAGNRCIIFSVGGPIDLTNHPALVVHSNVTIDGLSAPSPGITLLNTKPSPADTGPEPAVLEISTVNNVAVSNIVVRGIRIRSSPGDAIRVDGGAFNVVIDRVSITEFGDGAIDVVGLDQHPDHPEGFAHNVTIQWSILGHGRLTPVPHNFVSLLARGGNRISVHHNLYIEGQDRQPKCGGIQNAAPPPDTGCDVRNNLIWNYKQRGTFVGDFGTGNVVNNYYKNADGVGTAAAIDIDRNGKAFVGGNHLHGTGAFSVPDGQAQEFPAVIPNGITDAPQAARDVKAGAGARSPGRFELDGVDSTFIGTITLP